jgi:ribonuclease HI
LSTKSPYSTHKTQCINPQAAVDGIALFTDVSLNPKLKLGVGAYLMVPAPFLDLSPQSIERPEIAGRLMIRRFERTSSTSLEVQTVLWALKDYRNGLKGPGPGEIQVYSDSQCVAGLLKRRPGLETDGLPGQSTNRPLKNISLYRKFYEFYDEMDFEVIKVAGHSRSCSHNTIHRIFSMVDKEVRKALKRWLGELSNQ